MDMPRLCLADEGEVCFAGDWQRWRCPPNVACQPVSDRRQLSENLYATAMSAPESGYLTSHAVYTLLKFGEWVRAMEVVEACAAAGWWCAVLRGHLMWSVGQSDGAEMAFREASERAPAEVWCDLTDPTRLAAEWPADLSECSSEPDSRPRFWWLSDPFYVYPGNDRWVEHVDRAFSLQMLNENNIAEVNREYLGRLQRALVQGAKETCRI